MIEQSPLGQVLAADERLFSQLVPLNVLQDASVYTARRDEPNPTPSPDRAQPQPHPEPEPAPEPEPEP